MRLNLLRIIKSVVEAADENGDLIESVGLGEVIRETAKIDPAILVREMASDLLKSSELNASRAAHSARAAGLVGEANRVRPLRRSSSSTMIPGGVSSMPPTPISERPSISRAGSYFDPGADIARSSAAAQARALQNHSPSISTSSPYRPLSRDSNSGGHGTSSSSASGAVNWSALNSPTANGFVSNINNGVGGMSPGLGNVIPKSRLPRTSISGRPGSSRLGPTLETSVVRRPRSARSDKNENLTPVYQARPSSRLGHGQEQSLPRNNGTTSVRRSRRLTSGETR